MSVTDADTQVSEKPGNTDDTTVTKEEDNQKYYISPLKDTETPKRQNN